MISVDKIKGMNTIIGRLNASRRISAGSVEKGLIEGGRFLQRKSMQIVPVQIGTLRDTAETRVVAGRGFSADIVVSYGTDYGVEVHEDLTLAHGARFNKKYAKEIAAAIAAGTNTAESGMFYRKEEEQAKYLEKPARLYRGEIFGIIADEVRIK